MKAVFTILSILGFAWSLQATQWERLGPAGYTVLNYYSSAVSGCMEVLCTNDGILCYQDDEWREYSYGGLPVWEVCDHSSGHLLVAMGDGSESDGVYDFSPLTGSFTLCHWAMLPHFLVFEPFMGLYYLGSGEGLAVSPDGWNWTPVPSFMNLECLAMAASGPHITISTTGGMYLSHDGGDTWNAAPPGTPLITDFAVVSVSDLWGVFPGFSYSSGLWRSPDFGSSWIPEIWSPGMSSVESVGEWLFVSWEQAAGDYEGVARVDTETGELYFLNEGLDCHQVFKLSQNTLIDCYNLVACTADGAFFTFDLEEVDLHLTIERQGDLVVLSWNPYPDALGYKIYSSPEAYSGFTEDNTGVFNGTSWTALAPGRKHFYRVRAVLTP